MSPQGKNRCTEEVSTPVRQRRGRGQALAIAGGTRRRRSGDGAPAHLLGGRQPHVPDEAEVFEGTDDPPGQVVLPPGEPVSGRGREGVVVVVPALAEDEEGDEPVVPRLVARPVVLPSEQVADRVHREGGVLVEEDADQA